MEKPFREYIFRQIGRLWRDAASGRVLADVLAEYNIIVDDRTQFARLYDFSAGVKIYYRAAAGKVSLTIWEIAV